MLFKANQEERKMKFWKNVQKCLKKRDLAIKKGSKLSGKHIINTKTIKISADNIFSKLNHAMNT